MKRVKILLTVIFTSIILQIVILTILDRYYLVDNYKVMVSYLDKKGTNTNKELNNTLKIKNDNYIVSHNEQLIKIYDKKNNTEDYIPSEEGNKFKTIKSSDNGSKLLIVEKGIKNGDLKNYSYNIEKHIKIREYR